MENDKPKRPRDANQLARKIVGIATGEEQDECLTPEQERAKAAGRAGGKARAASLSKERRSEIARKAAKARWDHRD